MQNEQAGKEELWKNEDGWWLAQGWWEKWNGSEGQDPANRRGHSLTTTTTSTRRRRTTTTTTTVAWDRGEDKKEYIIMTGGFTKDDQESFPVWAFDTSAARWLDWGSAATNANDEWPPGRIGHVSAVRNNVLYVFGGFSIADDDFFVSDTNNDHDDGGGGGENDERSAGRSLRQDAVVWRVSLENILSSSSSSSSLQNLSNPSLQWERMTGATIFTEIPRPLSEDQPQSTDRARPASLYSSEYRHPERTIPRGYARGAHWQEEDAFIFHGGLHIKPLARRHHVRANNDTTTTKTGLRHRSVYNLVLGDVWRYDYDLHQFTLLSRYPPQTWQRHHHPAPRWLHTATVLGDQLIVYGGADRGGVTHAVGPVEDVVANVVRGDDNWEALSDVWTFDLHNLQWTAYAHVEPNHLRRTYATLVATRKLPIYSTSHATSNHDKSNNNNSECENDITLIVHGGFRAAGWISGVVERLFSSTLFLSLQESENEEDSLDDIIHWRTLPLHRDVTTVQNPLKRWDHGAVLDAQGRYMYVWGGAVDLTGNEATRVEEESSSFPSSSMSRLDLWSLPANLPQAAPDELDRVEAQATILNLLLAVFMLAAFLVLTAAYSTVLRQRQQRLEEEAAALELAEIRQELLRRQAPRGLPKQLLETFPVVPYQPSLSTTPPTGEEEREGCIICLIDYEANDELRELPCGHQFHCHCVDAWLQQHTSCPSCRLNLEPERDDDDGEEEGDTDEGEEGNNASVRGDDGTRQRSGLEAGDEEDAPAAGMSGLEDDVAAVIPATLSWAWFSGGGSNDSNQRSTLHHSRREGIDATEVSEEEEEEENDDTTSLLSHSTPLMTRSSSMPLGRSIGNAVAALLWRRASTLQQRQNVENHDGTEAAATEMVTLRRSSPNNDDNDM